MLHGGDATYIIRWLDRIAEYRLRWVEEPVPPDRIGDFAAIKRATHIPIATGEHEYTRWGFLQLLQADAIEVIQADPDWCGGITELVKICTLASSYGRPVFPHGHSIHPTLHVIAAQSPAECPMAEFLIWPPCVPSMVRSVTLRAASRTSNRSAAPGRRSMFAHLVTPERMVTWMGQHAELNPVPWGSFAVDIRCRPWARHRYRSDRVTAQPAWSPCPRD